LIRQPLLAGPSAFKATMGMPQMGRSTARPLDRSSAQPQWNLLLMACRHTAQ